LNIQTTIKEIKSRILSTRIVGCIGSTSLFIFFLPRGAEKSLRAFTPRPAVNATLFFGHLRNLFLPPAGGGQNSGKARSRTGGQAKKIGRDIPEYYFFASRKRSRLQLSKIAAKFRVGGRGSAWLMPR
jgi:hypothetical protein